MEAPAQRGNRNYRVGSEGAALTSDQTAGQALKYRVGSEGAALSSDQVTVPLLHLRPGEDAKLLVNVGVSVHQ